jgi:hypothetical protein
MDLKFYEKLLDKAILKVYGNRITVDKKGIFEWSKSTMVQYHIAL